MGGSRWLIRRLLGVFKLELVQRAECYSSLVKVRDQSIVIFVTLLLGFIKVILHSSADIKS